MFGLLRQIFFHGRWSFKAVDDDASIIAKLRRCIETESIYHKGLLFLQIIYQWLLLASIDMFYRFSGCLLIRQNPSGSTLLRLSSWWTMSYRVRHAIRVHHVVLPLCQRSSECIWWAPMIRTTARHGHCTVSDLSLRAFISGSAC